MVLDSSTLLDTFRVETWFFQEATWAFWPEAVLNLCKDSLKLGPASMELSLPEPLVGLRSVSLW